MTQEELEAADLLITAIQKSIASRSDRYRDIEALRSRWQFDLKNATGPRIADVICQRLLANGQSHLLRDPALRRFLFQAPFNVLKNTAIIAVASYSEPPQAHQRPDDEDEPSPATQWHQAMRELPPPLSRVGPSPA
jgi:hypothetical protein